MSFLQEIMVLKSKIPHKTNPQIEAALKVANGLWGEDPEIKTVGAFGTLVFEVSTLKVETLRNVKRQSKARYATHEIVGRKSVLEYVGLEPDEITFEMQLNEGLGVNVQSEIGKLLEMLRSGESNYLILGTHAYGEYKWVLETVTINEEYADERGNVEMATANVTLKEVLPDD